MFLLPVLVPFASDDTPPVVRAGFDAIATTLRGLEHPPADVPTTAELPWGALHGLVALRRAGRFPAAHQEERIATLVALVTA